MRTLSIFVMLILLAIGATPARADDLETLAPATALTEVQKTRGVVFVDLYADW